MWGRANQEKSQKASIMAEIHLMEAQMRKKVNELKKNLLYYLVKDNFKILQGNLKYS